MPDHGEVGDATEVLSDSNGVVHVEHHVPPAPRNEHCLSWTLQDLKLHRGGGRGGGIGVGGKGVEN